MNESHKGLGLHSKHMCSPIHMYTICRNQRGDGGNICVLTRLRETSFDILPSENVCLCCCRGRVVVVVVVVVITVPARGGLCTHTHTFTITTTSASHIWVTGANARCAIACVGYGWLCVMGNV